MLQKYFLRIQYSHYCIFLVAILSYTIFLFFLLKNYSFNFSGVVIAGDYYSSQNILGSNFLVIKDSKGYDGQFYYRLALNPFTNNSEAYGIKLDNPPYRQQRILYPLITWLITLGNHRYIPFALVFVNFVSIIFITYFSIRLVEHFKYKPIYSLLFSFYPGLLFALSRDLSEILETALLVSGVYFYEKNKFLTSAIVLSLALLTRETSLIVVLCLFIYEAFRNFKKRTQNKGLYFLIPISIYGLKSLILSIKWNGVDTLFPTRTGTPFLGFIDYIRELLTTNYQRVHFIEIGFILIFLGIIFISIAKQIYNFVNQKDFQIDYKYIFIWLIYFGLYLSLSGLVWQEDFGYMRAITNLFIMGYIILLKSKRTKTLTTLLFLNSFLWIYLARYLLFNTQ